LLLHLPMNPRLTKPMRVHLNRRSYSLVEIMIAAVFGVILTGAVLNFYVLSKRTYSSGVSRQWLQDGANIMLSKMIQERFRLSEAASFSTSGLSELHFKALNETVDRSYRLNGSSTVLIYNSGAGDEAIYTAPTGVTLTLRFSQPYSGTIGIDVALTQTVAGTPVSGSASTYISIRNR
jgi:hypothetical protein